MCHVFKTYLKQFLSITGLDFLTQQAANIHGVPNLKRTFVYITFHAIIPAPKKHLRHLNFNSLKCVIRDVFCIRNLVYVNTLLVWCLVYSKCDVNKLLIRCDLACKDFYIRYPGTANTHSYPNTNPSYINEFIKCM